MSYADVTARNSAPLSEQPHPDPALLNTTQPSPSSVVDETKKINILSPNLKTYPSERYPSSSAPKQSTNKEGEDRHYLPSPDVTTGILSLFNVAILGAVGYFSYVNWNEPKWGLRTISTVSVGLLTLAGSEPFLLAWYQRKRLSK